MKMEPVDEDTVKLVAHIMGPSSAAAAALADLEERRGNGERVAIFKAKGMWLAGPDLVAAAREDQSRPVRGARR